MIGYPPSTQGDALDVCWVIAVLKDELFRLTAPPGLLSFLTDTSRVAFKPVKQYVSFSFFFPFQQPL